MSGEKPRSAPVPHIPGYEATEDSALGVLGFESKLHQDVDELSKLLSTPL